MCGRYSVTTEEDILEMREILEEIQRRYAGDARLDAAKTGEIYPTNTVPVLMPDPKNEQRTPTLMRWGFPRYKGSGVIINARSETVNEKPTFRGAFSARRCLIPSTGFYEWTRDAGNKPGTKLLFRHPDRPMLYMAGLYGRFTTPQRSLDASTDSWEGFVIITTEANESVREIHNRMPLILDGSELDAWLYDQQAAMRLVAAPCPYMLEYRAG